MNKPQQFDVVCIGAGAAGVTAAVTAAYLGARVALLSKEPVGYGCTRTAMGYMAFPGRATGDKLERLLHDMLNGGEFLNDPELISLLYEYAPEAVAVLEGFGHLFKRDEEGIISERVLEKSGGHSLARDLHSTPATGISIGNALRAAAAGAQLEVMEETVACEVLVNSGRVAGVLCYRLATGEVLALQSKVVVLATGGAGWLYYPHTDCTRSVTGDGYALAYNAGAELIDMEQIQMLPFALTHPASMRGVLYGEASAAGPLGVLRNNRGEVIMENLSGKTRAEVTKAMAMELGRGGGSEYGGLLLDLSLNLTTEKGKAFRQGWVSRGGIDAVRFAYGEKAFRWEEPFDVSPSVHYVMGGIRINRCCESSISGLFAAGETAGGVNGGNRLGAMALLEAFVLGLVAGKRTTEVAKDMHNDLPPLDQSVAAIERLLGSSGQYRPVHLQRELQLLMWEKAGINRNKGLLEEAKKALSTLEEKCADLKINPKPNYNLEMMDAIELRHMITTARLIVTSALVREETRGAHLREDFPDRDDNNWLANIILKNEEGRLVYNMKEINRNHE